MDTSCIARSVDTDETAGCEVVELRFLRSETEAIFPDGVAHLMCTVETAAGALVCYRAMSRELSVVHIDRDFAVIDAVAIPNDTAERWPTGAAIHRVDDHGTSFLMHLEIHHRVDFKMDGIEWTTAGVRPRWYALEIGGGGTLRVDKLDFWEHA
ncbi:MAG: hypothetical protein MI724_15530, partial [Spirochaetales bacterium]|nr:hypothetical protein [Spirochaetales bacterium]